jgi:hypothetical protein
VKQHAQRRVRMEQINSAADGSIDQQEDHCPR